MVEKVEIVEHDPDWPTRYEDEAERLTAAFGSAAVAVHHIGSTAVAGLVAKPIIDILVEAKALDMIDARSEAIETLGYEALGEFGLPGRRYFRRGDAAGRRSHHVHSFLSGSSEVHRHLAFRDYLRAQTSVARAYGALKMQIVAKGADSWDTYQDAKHAFVQGVEQDALRWASGAEIENIG